jgi:hypothetical protein
MALQRRNERGECVRAENFKDLCGRFTVEELTGTLSEFADHDPSKDKLIECSLKMLTQSEADSRDSYFCLMNPNPGPNGGVSWAYVQNSKLSQGERAAIVMRWVRAGFLPMGWLVADVSQGWHTETDINWVPSEYRDAYLAIARLGMTLLVRTLDSGRSDGSTQ